MRQRVRGCACKYAPAQPNSTSREPTVRHEAVAVHICFEKLGSGT
jgi:hypothetical protein